MRIGSSRSSLSSRTALIARIAASPRLTMARRVKGARVGVTPPLCDRTAPRPSTRRAAEAPRSGRPHPPNGGVDHPRPVGYKVRGVLSWIGGDPRTPRAAAARAPRQLPHGGQRPGAAAAARDHELLGDLGARRLAAGRPLHADRAGPARPRRVGHAARRLLARRPRQRGARRRERARPRARDGRRATRSAAGSRCSSPTCSPSAPSAWCWSPAAGSAGRSICCCAPRRCPAPTTCSPR